MATAPGDGGSGGGSSAGVALEFTSIEAAVSRMKTISDTIGTLETTFKGFANGVSPTDWSTEPTCVQFGSSYKAAVDVYTTVIAGMKKDLANYAAALESASTAYQSSDTNSSDALAKLGAVDDAGLAQDKRGQNTYHDEQNHGVLSSDEPEKPEDTTPDGSRTTTLPAPPGASDGSGGSGGSGANNAAPTNGGAGQSTQPTGSEQGGLQ